MKYRLIDGIIGAAGAVCGFMWGEIDGLFHALIALIILDYISGVIKAIYQKKLSSEIGFKGICKKVMLFLVIAVANIIDVNVIKDGSVVRSAVLFLFIANEGISLLENAAGMGLPIPEKLLDTLKQLKLKNSNNARNGESTENESEENSNE